MKEVGILNADIISRSGHRDEIIVCDAGFSIPFGIRTVDLAIIENVPKVEDIIKELLKFFSVEELVIADDTKNTNPTKLNTITGQPTKLAKTHTRKTSALFYRKAPEI